MKMGDLLHVLAALPLVQESQHPKNKKVCVSTAGLDALGMMLMVKKESIITVNMITEISTLRVDICGSQMRVDGQKMQKKDAGANHNKKMRRFMRQLHKENDMRM
jgi:hypothetical protein